MKVTPGGGTPGESLLVEIFDVPRTAPGNHHRHSQYWPGRRSAVPLMSHLRTPVADQLQLSPRSGTTGNGNFRLTIPDWRPGRHSGPDWRLATPRHSTRHHHQRSSALRSTPSEVVPNQRISLVGAGFNARAKIGEG